MTPSLGRQVDKIEEALRDFVDCIDAVGGVKKIGPGIYAPAIDEEWTDLGYAYMQAMRALNLETKVIGEEDDDGD